MTDDKTPAPAPPPAPTISDARAIPCEEDRVSHIWYPTAQPGYVSCSGCGLKARDEA
jgi:hypothetical protein